MLFKKLITPQEAKTLGDGRSLGELENLAASRATCDCGQPVWRYGGVDLCFSCTTGESDASDDYELRRGC